MFMDIPIEWHSMLKRYANKTMLRCSNVHVGMIDLCHKFKSVLCQAGQVDYGTFETRVNYASCFES